MKADGREGVSKYVVENKRRIDVQRALVDVQRALTFKIAKSKSSPERSK